MPDDSWHIIFHVEKPKDQNLMCSCIKLEHGLLTQFNLELDEIPFHVGEGVWELRYGVQIMTLMHDSLRDHPARKLWQQWQTQQ